MNCVEPQVVALMSLSVDLILSFYLHSQASESEPAENSGENNGEPLSKRRCLVKPASSQDRDRFESGLNKMLRDLYDDFERVVTATEDLTPNSRLVFRILRELAIKSPDLRILHGLSDELINHLISIMEEQISPNLLLSFYSLTDARGRRNCAQAIVRLKAIQDDNLESEPFFTI